MTGLLLMFVGFMLLIISVLVRRVVLRAKRLEQAGIRRDDPSYWDMFFTY